MTDQPKRPRGLAAMTPERRREIQSMGGRAVPKEERAFSKDRELAREAGKFGGERKAAKDRRARRRILYGESAW